MKRVIVFVGLIVLWASLVWAVPMTGIARKLRQQTATQDLSAARLALTTSFPFKFRLVSASISVDAAVTGTVSLGINSVQGVGFDSWINVTSMSSATTYLFIPDNDLYLAQDDQVDLFLTGPTAGTARAVVTVEEIEA